MSFISSHGPSETNGNLLIPLRAESEDFSECALELLVNRSDLETGALAIELHS
jgi:hypothetical protein